MFWNHFSMHSVLNVSASRWIFVSWKFSFVWFNYEERVTIFAIVHRTLCRTISFCFSFHFCVLVFLFFKHFIFRMKHHKVSSMTMDLDNWNSSRKMLWYKNLRESLKIGCNLPIKRKEKKRKVWCAHLHCYEISSWM